MLRVVGAAAVGEREHRGAVAGLGPCHASSMGPTGSTVWEMEPLTCPRCGTEMRERSLGLATVSQCPEGHGVFLDRAELGTLIEAETDWHAGSGTHTAPLPADHPGHDRAPGRREAVEGVGGDAVRLSLGSDVAERLDVGARAG